MIELKIFCLLVLLSVCYAKTNNKVVCYYDSASHIREGPPRFTAENIIPALQHCTHVIYGYAAINDVTKKLIPLNEQFDTVRDNYRQVTSLKQRYPHVKFLLSVGGNADVSGEGEEKNIKYRDLIESSSLRLTFLNSALTIVKAYNFDGLDLAWEFPETKPKKIRSSIGSIWHSIKSAVSGPSIIDKKAEEHRSQFTALVRELKRSFKAEDLLVTLSVLPNVNSTVYYDPKNLSPHLDFVNLLTFDFYTPKRNPKEADFSAPLYELIDRRYDENIDYQVKYWLNNGAPASKILLGIATYGNTWKLTSKSNVNGVPPITADGPGEPGPITKDAGLLSYTEICYILKQKQSGVKGLQTEYKLVQDSSNRKGTYVFRLPDSDEKGGIWISYEDPETIANKAAFAKAKGLGGIALKDITLDDFSGNCNGEQYPLLKAAKNHI